MLTIVGEGAALKQVAFELGDSTKHLDTPQIIPMFVGIILGVLVGSIPLMLPGLPAPVKLGLAGGPLIVAIVLSESAISARWSGSCLPVPISHAGTRDHHVPGVRGNQIGRSVRPTLTEGGGLWWMVYGAMITFIPLVVVALIARIFMKLNYLSLCGLLAGSMTDPPALQFAHSFTGSDAPSVSYATVYPLVMLLRVLVAQIMVLLLMH